MKQLLLFILLSTAVIAGAQTKKNVTTKNKAEVASAVKPRNSEIDSLKMKVDTLLEQTKTLIGINNVLLSQIKKDMTVKERYKMYPTENMYNFLHLDTQTGKIEQVQWSLNENNEGSFTLNDTDLSFGFLYSSGSFELYPTSNMYQFILLDKTDGRKWHVQWGIGKEKRWIRPIF